MKNKYFLQKSKTKQKIVNETIQKHTIMKGCTL